MHGQDRIDLSAIDARADTAANEAFVFIGSLTYSHTPSEMRFTTWGGGNFCLLEADRDGDGLSDFQIFINRTAFMTTADFVL